MNMHMCTCSYMYIIYNVGVSLIRGGTIDLAEVTVSSTLHHMLESNSQLECFLQVLRFPPTIKLTARVCVLVL
jgi:hypothetical protein